MEDFRKELGAGLLPRDLGRPAIGCDLTALPSRKEQRGVPQQQHSGVGERPNTPSHWGDRFLLPSQPNCFEVGNRAPIDSTHSTELVVATIPPAVAPPT